MDQTEKRICWYSATLIVLLTNSPKLLALRGNGILAQYWHFDLAEWAFQVLYNLLFCLTLFYLNLKNRTFFSVAREQKQYGIYLLYNLITILTGIVSGTFIQRLSFGVKLLPGGILGGYLARFTLSTILSGIMIKIILLLRAAKTKETEHQQLKNAYTSAELELLKEQMNPHFLFNALSSLSGVIGENPALAQRYVKELSNVFRYSLVKAKTNLVSLQEELDMIRSFAQLITMRLEDAFKLEIDIDQALLVRQLPHLSLQPLLENAVKHNAATIRSPLTVRIYAESALLVVSNNLQEVSSADNCTGIGLANLNERFRIMAGQEIEIIKTANQFIIKLPLKA
ncbi:sensor histidine kinase [Mucilaginibacter sp. Mucisp84]|uniref:sensor histidine kinase n=1 Tax=Mucilaginibacter sp. Mucisp84 TaxID=3243058 RepID=UPI0039A529B6